MFPEENENFACFKMNLISAEEFLLVSCNFEENFKGSSVGKLRVTKNYPLEGSATVWRSS